jgi:hypothetical protein
MLAFSSSSRPIEAEKPKAVAYVRAYGSHVDRGPRFCDTESPVQRSKRMQRGFRSAEALGPPARWGSNEKDACMHPGYLCANAGHPRTHPVPASTNGLLRQHECAARMNEIRRTRATKSCMGVRIRQRRPRMHGIDARMHAMGTCIHGMHAPLRGMRASIREIARAYPVYPREHPRDARSYPFDSRTHPSNARTHHARSCPHHPDGCAHPRHSHAHARESCTHHRDRRAPERDECTMEANRNADAADARCDMRDGCIDAWDTIGRTARQCSLRKFDGCH